MRYRRLDLNLLGVLGKVHRGGPGITFEFRRSSGRVQDEIEASGSHCFG